MNKSCINCGAQLDEAAKFCAGCGTQQAEPPAQAEVQPPIQQAQPAIQPEAQPPKKKKSKKPLIIGGAVGAAALALAAVLIFTNVFGLFGKSGLFGTDGAWKDWKPTNFGKATFTLDEANSVSGEYIADGKTPLTLTTTDSNGLTWTLVIPTDGYYKPVTVTMTPMTGVSIGNFGSVPGGVQLSPDGISFTRPAKLTVSGEGITAKTNMLQGKHDGADVGFVQYENGGNSVTASLRHFSTEYPNNNDLPADNGSASNAAKDYFNNRPGLPPPPELTFDCYDGPSTSTSRSYTSDEIKNAEEEAIAYKYLYNEFLQPEIQLIDELKVTMMNGGDESECRTAIKNLCDSLYHKYWKLITGYAEEQWKAAAVVTEYMVIFNQENYEYADSSLINSLFAFVNRWASEIWNHWMGNLCETHNYKAAHSLEEVARYNRKTKVVDDYNYEKMISYGLCFKLEFTLNYTYESHTGWNTQAVLKGEAEPIRMKKPNDAKLEYLGNQGNDPPFWDEEAGGGTTYSYESYKYTHKDDTLQQTMTSNPDNGFMACLHTIDPHGDKSETGAVSIQIGVAGIGYYGGSRGGEAPMMHFVDTKSGETDDFPLYYDASYSIFQPFQDNLTNSLELVQKFKGPFFFFDADLHNEQEYCVIQTFEGSDKDYKNELQFQLIHTPMYDIRDGDAFKQWMVDPYSLDTDLENVPEFKPNNRSGEQADPYNPNNQPDFDPYAPNNAANSPNNGGGNPGGNGGGSTLPPQSGAAWPASSLPNGTPKYPDGKFAVNSNQNATAINIANTSAGSFSSYMNSLESADWKVTKLADNNYSATKDGWIFSGAINPDNTVVSLSFIKPN